jgi:hemin uptake protein HemP
MSTNGVDSVPPVLQQRPSSPLIEPRRIPSEQLLGGAGQAVIVHNGREYRLRQTRNRKLILTA